MKLTCNETGRITALESLDEEDIQRAVDRLIKRDSPGHFGALNRNAASLGRRHSTRETADLEWALGALRRVEIQRSVGGLTEHTGDFVNFTIG